MHVTAELAALRQKIDECRKHIEGQEILLEVLEHDGHDVDIQWSDLRVERAKLARLIAQEIELVTDAE